MFNTELSDHPNPLITAVVVYETELWYMEAHYSGIWDSTVIYGDVQVSYQIFLIS